MEESALYNEALKKMSGILSPDEMAAIYNSIFAKGKDHQKPSKDTLDMFKDRDKDIGEIKKLLGEHFKLHKGLDEKLDNITKVMTPMAKTYENVEVFGRWGKTFLLVISIIIGIIATASGLFWGWWKFLFRA